MRSDRRHVWLVLMEQEDRMSTMDVADLNGNAGTVNMGVSG